MEHKINLLYIPEFVITMKFYKELVKKKKKCWGLKNKQLCSICDIVISIFVLNEFYCTDLFIVLSGHIVD